LRCGGWYNLRESVDREEEGKEGMAGDGEERREKREE